MPFRFRVSRLQPAIVFALLLSLCAGVARADFDARSLPKPAGYVSDLAGVVSAPEKQVLEEFCTRVEQQLGVEFALVTINTIGDQPIRDVALDIAREWGVGAKKDNQGVLLLLVIRDRKSDIETGRGIEPYITDGFAGSTLRSMRPELQAGEYGAALLTAAQSMAAQIAQGKGIVFSVSQGVPQRPRRPAHDRGGGIPGPLILLGIFLLFWLLSRGGGRRGGGYRGGGGGGGFIPGLILGGLLNSGRRDDPWRGGGGGGFGGDSGGGGGFGGFGGGDFGGGGASSDW